MKGYIVVLTVMMTCLLLLGCAGVPAPQEVVAESIDSVNQSSNVVTNEMEPWVLGIIILLAGWAIPSPYEMFRGFIKIVSMLLGR